MHDSLQAKARIEVCSWYVFQNKFLQ